ncbi:hypothetical protein [Cupriavidus sp. amp6]|uniref:hypothetical protein n=1 Tax=Cupriavidus sp. amp6 TaxID=388051 RepID=UPI0012ECB6D1|nr:hypothetical protein [Cupriavidus sp. amp6]
MQESEQHEQHRCGHANGRIAGDQTNADGRGRHRQHRDQEDHAPAESVAQAVQDGTAERRNVPERKDAEGANQRSDGICRWKELRGDLPREDAVDDEVVPANHQGSPA